MKIYKLLDAQTDSGFGQPVVLNSLKLYNGQNLPLIISGVIGDVITLYGSFDGITYSPIERATFWENGCWVLGMKFTYIKAHLQRDGGTVTVEIGV